jgi:hypothetical protein
VFYAFVFVGMYRGRSWARFTFFAVMGANCVGFALVTPLDAVSAAFALIYLSLGLAVLISPIVVAHFRK